MFENLTVIPYTEDEANMTFQAFGEIVDKLSQVVNAEKYRTLWSANYTVMNIASVLAMLTAMDMEDDHVFKTAYYENNEYRFSRRVNDQDSKKCGIWVNQEAGTHFEATRYAGATYLTNAEDFLKQSPHHFLKIFTVPDNNTLFVWTNKQLNPETIYKLYSLEAAVFPKDTPTAKDFIEACLEKNVDKARNVLETFFNSDKITELEFKKFQKCLANKNNSRIRNLEDSITRNRDQINNYEDTIARLASEMREFTEQIYFLKSLDANEEDKLFYKHLQKIPYITSFQAYETGCIELNYQAPLIYFSELPAEKIIEQNYRPVQEKQIVKIILGRKYELWTKCKLTFFTDNFSVDNQRTSNTIQLLPHPHIDRYGCFGNHRAAIRQSAEAGDYIGAIEQITQAVLNLNFYDGCVVNAMLQTLKDKWTTLPTWKCVETGEMLTTAQVIERDDYYEEA